MKQYTSLLLIFLVSSAFCQTKTPCNYYEGDILKLSQSGVPLKADSSINGKIILKITGSRIVKNEYSSFTDEYYRHFNLEVIDGSLINNFIKVKLTIKNTDGVQDYLKFDNILCWVDTQYVWYPFHVCGEGNGVSLEKRTESINEMNRLKKLNSCEYDAYYLALCYLQRGIKNYI